MGSLVDISGHRFGRLVVTGKTSARTNSGGVVWECRCDCGNRHAASSIALRSGDSRSCGCLFIEIARAKGLRKLRHGMTGTATHNAWSGMRGRCLNKNNPKYSIYGGRGIVICARWSSFENFLSDMGERPGDGYSLDRINVDGAYEPTNCRWATHEQQQNNRRNNVLLLVDGELVTLSRAARLRGLRPDTVQQRLKAGDSHVRALRT